MCDHANKSYCIERSRVTLYYAVQGGSNFLSLWIKPQCHRSNESYCAVLTCGCVSFQVSYLPKVRVMWGWYWGNEHSNRYWDSCSSSRWDSAFSSNVAQTVMSVEVSVMEGSRIHGCCGHLPVIDTAADQSFTCIKHGATHETATLR